MNNVFMQVAQIRLTFTASERIGESKTKEVQDWLNQWTCKNNFKTIIGVNKWDCLQKLKNDISEVVPHFSFTPEVKSSDFEFQVSLQPIENGRFWTNSSSVWSEWYAV